MWVLSERPVKVGIESTYASFDLAEPRSLVSKSGCRVAVKFPNRLNTHFFSGCKVDDPLNTHSTPTIFFTVMGRYCKDNGPEAQVAGGRSIGAVGADVLTGVQAETASASAADRRNKLERSHTHHRVQQRSKDWRWAAPRGPLLASAADRLRTHHRVGRVQQSPSNQRRTTALRLALRPSPSLCQMKAMGPRYMSLHPWSPE